MASIKYAYQGENENTARALARNVRISNKEAYEAANAARGKTVTRAKKFFANVIETKEAIPYKRYNSGVPHRAGIGPGRYPKNTSQAMIKLLNEVEANAEARGLNTDVLKITHLAVHKATQLRGSFKGSSQYSPMTHIEIIVKEMEESKKATKPEKKEEPVEKKETKKEEKKPDKKEDSQ